MLILEIDISGLELRDIKNITYQPQQKLAVRRHILAVGGAAHGVVGGGEQLGEANNGVKRGADFVAHIGKERRLQLVRLFGFNLGLFERLKRLGQLRHIECGGQNVGVAIERQLGFVDVINAVAHPVA